MLIAEAETILLPDWISQQASHDEPKRSLHIHVCLRLYLGW